MLLREINQANSPQSHIFHECDFTQALNKYQSSNNNNNHNNNQFDMIIVKSELAPQHLSVTLESTIVISIDRRELPGKTITSSVITMPYKYNSVYNMLLRHGENKQVKEETSKMDSSRHSKNDRNKKTTTENEDQIVLIVDDNSINQKVLHLMLSKLQLKADIACNGVEAVEMAKKKAYSAIFMDLMVSVI